MHISNNTKNKQIRSGSVTAVGNITNIVQFEIVPFSIPYKSKGGDGIETTIGQLNFFKWALENEVVDYIEQNYTLIENDMNNRNSTSKRKEPVIDNKTRKRREELSISASKSIKKEDVEIVLTFH